MMDDIMNTFKADIASEKKSLEKLKADQASYESSVASLENLLTAIAKSKAHTGSNNYVKINFDNYQVIYYPTNDFFHGLVELLKANQIAWTQAWRERFEKTKKEYADGS